MAIAFFDLDHTLLDGANGNMAMGYMVRKRLMPPSAVLRALWYTVLYKLNHIPYMEVYRWTFRECGRFHVDELISLLDEAYETSVLPNLFREGKEEVARHREAGRHTVIATAAGEYMAEKVRVQLGADAKIAAMAPFVDGYLTEDFDLPLPYGEGKLSRALSTPRHGTPASGTAGSTRTAWPTCPCSKRWVTPWRPIRSES